MKIAVCSHCTIDEIIVSGAQTEQIGGSACYCGLTGKTLKLDVILNTKFGGDFPQEYLLKNNLQIYNSLSERPTTRFRIQISGSERILYLINECEQLDYYNTDADGFIISPVYHEISNLFYNKIKNDSKFILLDPQGFLRQVNSNNQIQLVKTNLDFTKISAIKTSPDEIFCLTNKNGLDAMKVLQNQGIENVILTNKRDISLLLKDKLYSITLPNLELYDTTGIGDIFCSAFCCTILKEQDFFWALCFAGGAAQAALETRKIGLEKIPSKNSIETNAAYFYNQVKFKQV